LFSPPEGGLSAGGHDAARPYLGKVSRSHVAYLSRVSSSHVALFEREFLRDSSSPVRTISGGKNAPSRCARGHTGAGRCRTCGRSGRTPPCRTTANGSNATQTARAQMPREHGVIATATIASSNGRRRRRGKVQLRGTVRWSRGTVKWSRGTAKWSRGTVKWILRTAESTRCRSR